MPRSGATTAAPRQGRAASGASGPTDLAVAEELLASLASIRRQSRRVGRRPVLLSSLTGAQLELMRLVQRRPGISVAEAAEELHLAPNTVSTLVRQLTEAGFVVRVTDEADRRVARLALDAGVRRQVDAWLDRRAIAVERAVASLPAASRRRLVDALPALRRLADELHHHEESP